MARATIAPIHAPSSPRTVDPSTFAVPTTYAPPPPDPRPEQSQDGGPQHVRGGQDVCAPPNEADRLEGEGREGRIGAEEPDGDEKLDLRFVHDPADDPCCQESQQQASTQIYDQRPVGEVRPDPPGSPNGNEVTGIGPQDSPDTDQDCGLSKQDALTSVGSHDGVGALGAANLLWSTSPVRHHTGLRGPLPCLPTNSSASPVGRLSDGQSGV